MNQIIDTALLKHPRPEYEDLVDYAHGPSRKSPRGAMAIALLGMGLLFDFAAYL